jgi:hypothetical protein
VLLAGDGDFAPLAAQAATRTPLTRQPLPAAGQGPPAGNPCPRPGSHHRNPRRHDQEGRSLMTMPAERNPR